MRLVVEDIWTWIHGSSNYGIIDAVTSYKVPGRFFANSFKNRHWDGIKRFREYDRSAELYKFPSGLLDRVAEAMDAAGQTYEIDDRRVLESPDPVYKLPGGKELRDYQREALDTLLAKGRGIVKLVVGGGKTKIGAALIASHNKPTLWLTDRTLLLHQSFKSLSEDLEQPIGIIGDDELDIKPITVSMVQTITSRFHLLNKELEKFEVLILDEAHHASSETWAKIINSVPAPYRFGLTATPTIGADGLRVVGATGEIAYELGAPPLIAAGFLVAPKIIWTKTVTPSLPSKAKWAEVYKNGIVQNGDRNGQVADIAWKNYIDSIPTITMVNQIGHGQILLNLYERLGLKAVFMTSRMNTPQRDEALKALKAGKLHHIIAVTSILGEGTDLPFLPCVINATGARGGGSQTEGNEGDSGRVTQQMLGRILRPFPGKTECWYYDFLDAHHKSLKAATKMRIAALAEAGFEEYFVNAAVSN